jgi:hypothetical protein
MTLNVEPVGAYVERFRQAGAMVWGFPSGSSACSDRLRPRRDQSVNDLVRPDDD